MGRLAGKGLGRALAADLVFVIAWWLLVYRPGDPLASLEPGDAATIGDQPIRSAIRLPPDGAHALALVDEEDLAWVEYGAIDAADWSPAQPGRGTLRGQLIDAVAVDGSLAVLVERSGSTLLYRWHPQSKPERIGEVDAASWLDLRGEVQPLTSLGIEYADERPKWAGPSLVVVRPDRFEVRSRTDGRVLQTHEFGSSDINVRTRGEHGRIVWGTSASNRPRQLDCAEGGSLPCPLAPFPADWPRRSSAVALSDDGLRVAACHEGATHLYEFEGSRGIFLAQIDTACVDLLWRPGGLWIEDAEALRAWDLREVAPRPLTGAFR